jgi:hypothetical protein
VELAVQLYRAIPNAALCVLPGAGHAPIFGEWKQAFATAALAFLRDDRARLPAVAAG